MGFGGGGSSGKVEYPAYLQDCHGDWLDKGGTIQIESCINTVMNTALGNSPFTGITAYDPDSDLVDAEVPLTTFKALSITNLWSDALSQIALVAAEVDAVVTTASTTAKITAVEEAYSDMLDAEVSTKILPKFRRGMQNIGAVQASSFVVGEALIYAEKARDVAKFTADLELRAFDKRNDMIVQLVSNLNSSTASAVDFYKTMIHYSIEFARIKFTAKKEESDFNVEMDEKDAEWDLKVFQHGGNLMAAIAGAAATVNKKPNMIMSALGGALSGAAAGASLGPYGAAGGAILGGLSGLLG